MTATNGYAPSYVDVSPEVKVAVMGPTGSGKSTFINLASGSSLPVSRGLQSCTSEVQLATPFVLDGRPVVLIDTPGFDDTTKSDSDILKMIAAFLETSYEKGALISGVLYFHRISDVRMGGISTRNFKMFRRLCGDSTLKNVVIATTMWSNVPEDLGAQRETELKTDERFFKPVLDREGRMMRHDNTVESAHNILRGLIANHPVPLQIQKELVTERKNLTQTEAGGELNLELMEQIRRHQAEVSSIRQEMKEAIDARDAETRKELEQEKQKLDKEISRMERERENLAADYSTQRQRLQEQFDAATRDAGRYMEQIKDLERRLQETSEGSATDRARFERELEELRNRKHSGGCTIM